MRKTEEGIGERVRRNAIKKEDKNTKRKGNEGMGLRMKEGNAEGNSV